MSHARISGSNVLRRDLATKWFLFFVGLTPTIKYLPVLAILLICVALADLRTTLNNKLVVFFLVQYAIIGLFFNYLHSGIFGSVRLDRHYLLLIVLSPFIVGFIFHQKEKILKYSTTWISFGLIASFFILIFDFIFEFNGSRCHAWGWMFNSLAPAMMIAPLLAIVFHNFSSRPNSQRVLPLVVLCMAIISVSALSGARMGFYIALFLFLTLIFREVFCRHSGGQGSKNTRDLVIALLLGISVSWLLDNKFSCNFYERLGYTLDSARFAGATILGAKNNIDESDNVEQALKSKISDISLNAQPTKNNVDRSEEKSLRASEMIERGMPVSEATRLALWVASVDAIRASPMLGYGTFRESHVITGKANVDLNFASHNQYLSWFLWGGIFVFFSGIFFLIIPILPVESYKPGFTSFAVVSSWALAFLTDQPLLFPQILLPFVISLLLSRALDATSKK